MTYRIDVLKVVFIGWLLGISSLIWTSSDLLKQQTFLLFVLLVPSALFCLDDSLALPTFLCFYLLRRFFIIFDNYISTYLIYFLGSAAIVKVSFRKVPLTASFLRSLLLLFTALAGYDLLIKFALYGTNNGIESFQTVASSHLLSWLSTFATIILAYYYCYFFETRLAGNNDKSLFVTLFLANISYALFLVNNASILQRVVVVSEVIGLETTSFTRVDPNFYVSETLIIALLFLRRKGLLVALLMLLFVLNALYLNSMTGFVLIIFVTVFLFLRKKTPARYAVTLIAVALILFIASIPAYLKYLEITNTIGVSQYGALNLILTGRIEKWFGYIRLILDNPFGLGRDSAWKFTTKYIGYATYAHNFYIQTMADHGILLGGVLIIYLLAQLRDLYRIRKSEPQMYIAYLLFLLAGTVLSNNYTVPMFFLLAMRYTKELKVESRRNIYEDRYSLST